MGRPVKLGRNALLAPKLHAWRSRFMLGLVPLAFVALVMPDAIDVDGMPADVSRAGRVLAGTIDHGITLVVGHVLAIAVIVLRILADRDRA